MQLRLTDKLQVTISKILNSNGSSPLAPYRTMSAIECFDLGKTYYNIEDVYNSPKWFFAAYKQWTEEETKTVR